MAEARGATLDVDFCGCRYAIKYIPVRVPRGVAEHGDGFKFLADHEGVTDGGDGGGECDGGEGVTECEGSRTNGFKVFGKGDGGERRALVEGCITNACEGVG